jgi:hypothetical protein
MRSRLRDEHGAVRGPGTALRRSRRGGRDLDLAHLRNRAAVLDRVARSAHASVREERGLVCYHPHTSPPYEN